MNATFVWRSVAVGPIDRERTRFLRADGRFRPRCLQEDGGDGAAGQREERAGDNEADGLEDAHASLLCKDYTYGRSDVPSRDSGGLAPTVALLTGKISRPWGFPGQ
ncbi:MAG: hypothetical protein ACJ78X_12835 [Myxococcales bacterium]